MVSVIEFAILAPIVNMILLIVHLIITIQMYMRISSPISNATKASNSKDPIWPKAQPPRPNLERRKPVIIDEARAREIEHEHNTRRPPSMV